jgi:ankyrin repeat protein
MGCASSVVPNQSRSDSAQKQTFERNTDFMDDEGIQTLSSGLEFAEAVSSNENVFLIVKRGDLSAFNIILSNHNNNPALPHVNKLVGMWESSLLIVALQYGHIDIAQILLAQTDLGDLAMRNSKGADALLFACMEGMDDIVKRLLALGVRPSVTPTSHPVYNLLTDQSLVCSPLSIAVYNGRQTVVKMLLDICEESVVALPFRFATLKSIQRGGASATDVTPLSMACAMGRLGVVRELLWHNCVCVAHVDSDGSTALHHLCRAKEDVTNIFMELCGRNLITDALLHTSDALGDTALHVATDHKQEGLVLLLLEEGLVVSTKNVLTGGTALHVAIKRKSLQLVQILLDYGADPLAINVEGKSPFDLAQKLRADSDIYLLISKSASSWQGFRGISKKAKSEVTEQPHIPVEPAFDQLTSNTAAKIMEQGMQLTGGGEDDVTEFISLDDSFVVSPHQLNSSEVIETDCANENIFVVPSSQCDFDSPSTAKDSHLMVATPTALSLRPAPPPSKDRSTSFKRGVIRGNSSKPLVIQPSSKQASVTPAESSAIDAPLFTSSAVLPFSAPTNPTSAGDASPRVKGRFSGSAKMPRAPSSSRKEKRGLMLATK